MQDKLDRNSIISEKWEWICQIRNWVMEERAQEKITPTKFIYKNES